MRIGIFTEMFWPGVGGQEIRFEQLSVALADRGHDVCVYCISEDPGLPEHEVHGGVKIWRCTVDAHFRSQRISWLRNPITILRHALRLRRIVEREPFDVVLYNIWPVFHILLAPASVRRRAVVDWCEIQQNLPFRMLQRWLPGRVGFNLGVSPSVTREIARVPGAKVQFVASGLTISAYACRHRADRHGILYLGRITAHKNVALLVEAFARLKARGYAGRLTIAGSGPDLANLREAVQRSSAKDGIDVLGGVDDARKIALLASTEIVVIPSRREGFPRVIAEAMVSGAPVVTVDYPQNGSCDVVRHYGCGLVTAPDPDALATGIQSALANWDRFSETGRAGTAELDWTIIAAQLERYIAPPAAAQPG
jgi:glycosyltransferase involved in cell wall biosynthesis